MTWKDIKRSIMTNPVYQFYIALVVLALVLLGLAWQKRSQEKYCNCTALGGRDFGNREQRHQEARDCTYGENLMGVI